MKDESWSVIAVALLIFFVGILIAFSAGYSLREKQVVAAWNRGHTEGYSKAYCDNVDKFMNKIGEIIVRYESKLKEEEKIPLLNRILELK